jgi:glycosyltransferase involved in cell wall biosynthesis
LPDKINILVIGKQKKDHHLSVITQRQVESLQNTSAQSQNQHFNIFYCSVKGYLKSFSYLKKCISHHQPTIIHAHYSLIGMLTLLARRREKVVVSFMGSDVYQNRPLFKLARWFVLKKSNHIIVKSERLRERLPAQENISVIPNGVNLDLFAPSDKKEAQNFLNWSQDTMHILFPAGKDRYEKDFPLAKKAFEVLHKKHNIELHILENTAPNDVPIFLNAADLVLLTSRWEGSSNITKEAMACNTAIVSTDVGDTNELFRNIPGYFISEHKVSDIVEQIEKAFDYLKEKKKPLGRKRIIDLNLDESYIAEKILRVYENIANE